MGVTEKHTVVLRRKKTGLGEFAIRVEKTIERSTAGGVFEEVAVSYVGLPPVKSWEEDRLLILPDYIPDRTAGGILLPQVVVASELTNTGTIVACGAGRYDPDRREFVNQVYKPGQRVIFGRRGGVEYEHAGVKYKIMRPMDISGVLFEEAKVEDC